MIPLQPLCFEKQTSLSLSDQFSKWLQSSKNEEIIQATEELRQPPVCEALSQPVP